MNSFHVITSKRVMATVTELGYHMRELLAEKCSQNKQQWVKFLDMIKSVDPFNPSCYEEIFELQHV